MGPEELNRRDILACLSAGALVACGGARAGSDEPVETPLVPEDFGAKGDGVTDDSQAFVALSEHLSRRGGGFVRLRRGAIYRVGRQAPGGGLHLKGEPILYARDVSRFIVDMNGATLKFRDGMKYGSFDPRTGRPIDPAMPFFDYAAVAHLGYAVLAERVGRFELRNGAIDGNSAGMIVGGGWGDVGRQLTHYGVVAQNCANVLIEDVAVRNMCLDGILCQDSGLTEADAIRPFVMRRCKVERAARNCVTVTATNSARIEDCEFSHAGEAPSRLSGPVLGSNPRSCLDIEAEGGLCRNIAIRRTRLAAGASSHTCFVADSGPSSDILVEDCDLHGVVWTRKPRTVFRKCRVEGAFVRLAGGLPNPADNSVIDGCTISDAPVQLTVVSGEGANATTASPIVIRNTTINAHNSGPNFRRTRLENVTVNVYVGTDRINAGDFVILIDGAIVRGLRIVDRIRTGHVPDVPFYVVGALTADMRDAEIVSSRNAIKWIAPTAAGGGYGGRFRGPYREGS